MKPSQPPPPRSDQRAPQLTTLNDPQRAPSSPPPHTARSLPRERLLERGPKTLTPAELVAVILNTGRGRSCDVSALAHELLRALGGLKRLCEASAEELQQVKGIGPVKAARLIAGFELARRAAPPQAPVDELGLQQELMSRLQRHAMLIEDASVTLLAYPAEGDFMSADRVLTLSLDQSLSALERPGDDQSLSLTWMRRLISSGCEAWSLAAVYRPTSELERPTLPLEQRALDRFTSRAALLGLRVHDYLIIHGDRYAWLKPSVTPSPAEETP